MGPKIEIQEKIIKIPRITNTVVHTCVENQVQTVEMEKPKIIQKTVQRRKPIVQDHVTQVPKVMTQTITVPKVQQIPVVKQRQVPMVQKVERTVEVPQIEYVDNHVHIPVHKHRHVPMVSVTQKHVEVPVIQTVEKIVDVPVVKQVDVPH